MKKVRGLFVLLMVFIALAVLVALQGRGIERDNQRILATLAEATPVFQRLFEDLAVAQLQAVRVQDANSGREFIMTRASDGTWTTPSGTLNPDAGTNIAQVAVTFFYTRTLPPPENNRLAEFGFQPYGQMLIQLLLNDGQQHIIAVGGALQTGPEFYALVDDRPELYVVLRQPFDALYTLLEAPPVDGRQSIFGESPTPIPTP